MVCGLSFIFEFGYGFNFVARITQAFYAQAFNHRHTYNQTLSCFLSQRQWRTQKKGIKFQTSKVGGLENKAPKARKARESWTKGKKRSDIDEWDEGKTGNTAAKCESHSTKKEKRRQENQTKLKKGKEGKEDRGTGLRTEIITGEKIMIMS